MAAQHLTVLALHDLSPVGEPSEGVKRRNESQILLVERPLVRKEEEEQIDRVRARNAHVIPLSGSKGSRHSLNSARSLAQSPLGVNCYMRTAARRSTEIILNQLGIEGYKTAGTGNYSTSFSMCFTVSSSH